MRTIQPTEILAYYDGVEVFSGQDSIGGHYVGSFIDAIGDADRYLVVGVRPERLSKFRSGTLDLRTLLLEAPDGEWYLTLVNGNAGQPLKLEPQSDALAATDYLPGAGFLLGDPELDIPELKRRIGLGKPVAVTGRVEVVNRPDGYWKVSTGAGMTAGKLAPGASLDGLQVGRAYCLHCVEIVEMDALWQDQRVLYLKAFEPA